MRWRKPILWLLGRAQRGAPDLDRAVSFAAASAIRTGGQRVNAGLIICGLYAQLGEEFRRSLDDPTALDELVRNALGTEGRPAIDALFSADEQLRAAIEALPPGHFRFPPPVALGGPVVFSKMATRCVQLVAGRSDRSRRLTGTEAADAIFSDAKAARHLYDNYGLTRRKPA